jgi:acetyl-CoA C-acetyltransferase
MPIMADAFIIDAVRTAVGRRNGGLAQVHPADMASAVLGAIVERTGIEPAAVDDVILGCVDQVGPQAGDIARTAWLAAGLPESVPGVTLDRQCGSSQQAVHFAAQAVLSGFQDVVIAGGVQNMSMIPISTAPMFGRDSGLPDLFHGSAGWVARYGTQEVSQFRGAEMMAQQWNFSRDAMEEYAVRSHERALKAQAGGAFDDEIVEVAGVTRDEGPRTPDWDKIRSLRPITPGGRLTAALASQISDGAAALLIASGRAITDHGLTPRARIRHLTVLGDDPIMMLSAPISATRRALERSGLSLDDIDCLEVNEAFAPVPLAWAKELGTSDERLNRVGGAIALGHPIGASGARLMTSLLGQLERTGGRLGLQVMCEGGGQANVTIIERV